MAARNAAAIDVDDELQQLLKEQEAFMRQNQRPAAKITRVGAATKPPEAHATQPPENEEEEEEEEEELMEDGPQVVGLVQERDVVTLNESNRRVQPPATSGGFPAVRRRGESLFGRRQKQQQHADAKLSGMGTIVERAPTVGRAAQGEETTAARSTRSDVVSEKEWNEIDQTNAAALQAMSTADIRAAQRELYSMLDPELLAKLKNRSKKPAPKAAATGDHAAAVAPVKPKAVVRADAADGPRGDVVAATKALVAAGIDLSKIETEEQLFEQAKRLPAEERAKHEWMQPAATDDAATAKRAANKKKRHPLRQSNAPTTRESKASSGERFDFDGDVVAVDAAPPSHSGLFHHGDDPDAAGYTMDELLHLARSTVASQRAVALVTISKILRKRPRRMVPRVLPAELPVALRMTLDDNNYTALSAAIAALHAFLCPAVDEAASAGVPFEWMRGSIVASPRIHLHVDAATTADELLHEVIYIDTGESEEDGSTIGDQELTSLDPIQGLLKMNIVTRVCYVVTTIQLPDTDAMDKLLDILVRIATHSPRGAQAVAANRKLMKALQTNYLENECVLTLQTEPKEEFVRAAALTHKALVLMRVLCQGSRAVATLLVETGVIQTTKGFLALRADQVELASNPLETVQLESLRLWRVLLGYGLDFHCFSYLYPLLCGFDGVNLVRDKSESAQGVKRWSDACLAAIFAALEAFARLDTIHEAQHYFNQFGFFIQLARSEIAQRLALPLEQSSLASDNVAVTALRFLAVCSKLVSKFHFERTPFFAVFKDIRALLAQSSSRERLVGSSAGNELLVSGVACALQVLQNDLLNDDEDDEEVCTHLFQTCKPLLARAIAADGVGDALQTCELLLLTTDLFLRVQHHDDEFIRAIYAAALKIVQDLKPGHQFWIHGLFRSVLFHPVVLQKTGFFSDLHDATTMGRVLVPIYQALVNSTKEQEEHSRLLFATATNPKQKQTCQLVEPQDEQDFVGSNLPLPFFWMFCPFSRLEYSSSPSDSAKQKHAATSLGPTHAEADEMKVIVSAACRYIDQLESIVGAVRSSSATGRAELGDEDKLFHLMHVFFAGTDVLFDEYVDLALSTLLKKYALSVLTNASPTALYDGMLRNLRQFESIEAGEHRADASSPAAASTDGAPTSFSSETETVMTFIEKLVNEFTSSSFGNTHFARLVTLFLLHDFPLEIRKWVWKELADSRLLHRLEPFGGTEARGATGLRSTREAKRSDETLVRTMKHAIAPPRQSGGVSHERGPFAYWLAVHHTAAYVFGDDASASTSTAELSFARQKLVQELIVDASPVVWRHLLSHDTTTFSPSPNAEIKQSRVDRVLQRAALSPTQVAAFQNSISSG